MNYYMREALASLVRNRLISLASVVVVSSCVFILTFSMSVALNIDYILEQLESSLGLSVYVEDGVPDAQVDFLFEKIKNIAGVESVVYISAEEALAKFGESLGDDRTALAGLEGENNPLPRSFDVELESGKAQDAVLHELEKLVELDLGIEDIRYDQDFINAMTALNTGIRIASLAATAFLIAISVVIIMNTIKLTVNNRRAEITIMKYIGATDWFIRWPFLLEGMLIGVIGALIPVVLCWLGYHGALQSIRNGFTLLQDLAEVKSAGAVFALLAPLSFFLGIGVGVIGSVTSIRRYLNV